MNILRYYILFYKIDIFKPKSTIKIYNRITNFTLFLKKYFIYIFPKKSCFFLLKIIYICVLLKTKNMKNIIIVIILTIYSITTYSQTIVAPSPIKWYTIQEYEQLNKKEVRPAFIDVYTEWCGWCTKMMQTTFANPGIANYINNNFYPVRFDAETHDTIIYNGKKYINKSANKKSTHDLAIELLKGQMSYPTIIYIDRKGNINPVPGYMKPTDLEPILIFFAEDINTNVNFDEFRKYFMYSFPKVYSEEIKTLTDAQKPDTLGKVNWISIEEASKLSVKNKKPLYIHFYTDWCQSCKVSDNTVFKNTLIAKELNEKYYPVRFNAASQDTITIYDQKMNGNGIGNPHQLSYSLLKGGFKLPADVYISDTKQMLNEMHGFLTPIQLESILKYFSQGAYLKSTYQEFMKTFKNEILK